MQEEWIAGQGGTLLREEGMEGRSATRTALPAPEAAAPGGMEEREDVGHARTERKDAEREAAEKEEYWNSVLTGDVATLPRDVRKEAESLYAPGMADNERVAACVMQSWVADTGGIPRERIRRDWKEIREQVARQYGASGRSDHELFLAVSQHNRIRLSQRETLFDLYQEAYDHALAGTGETVDERRWEAVSQWPEELQSVAQRLKSRAVSDALDDRTRLEDAAGIIRKGLEGLVAHEAPSPRGLPAVQVNWKAVQGVPDVARAVDCLAGLGDEDRRKVFRMMVPYLRSKPAFREALGAALKRGAAEMTENVAQMAVNGAAWAMPEGDAKAALDRYSRSFEELRSFARMEYAPLRGGKEAPWFRELLVDMAQQGASTALAFGGPAGLGVLMAGETGRHMADARRMNPDGVFDAQMGGAVLSGGLNTALSLGMTRLGQRVLGQGMRSFRALRSSGTAGVVLAGTGTMAADAVKMAAENKLMELTPMLAQEGVGLATGRESGVDWEGWKERQVSPEDQMREAAMMMPFLLIGAGKAALHHFRHPSALLGDGTPLKVFGIPEDTAIRILQEKDVHRAGELLRQSLRNSPLWGSLYISRKALEWTRALDEAGEPFLKTEQDVRDFLELPSPVRSKPWQMRDFPESEAALKSLFPHPEHAEARSRWLLRAGLPRLGESPDAAGGIAYDMEPAPGIPLKRVDGKASTEEALSSWYEFLCRKEEEDLGLIRNRNGREIPWRLRNETDYDLQAEGMRRSFVEERLKRGAYRPYRMLLLAYPDEAGSRTDFSRQDWDAVTREMNGKARANVYEGVMERVHGASQEEVSVHVAGRLWQAFCRDDYSSGRARRWLEEGSSLLSTPELLEKASSTEDLVSSLSRMSGMMARLGDRERRSVSSELQEMNRCVWGTQADVNGLFHVLPNMADFDVCIGRGYTPEESYGRLLARYLETSAAQVADYASVLDAGRLSAGPEQPVARVYPGTEKAVESLSRLTPRLFQSSGEGNHPLWRVRYPNGGWSAWHPSREAAGADLMANVSMMFSPACTAKRELIRGWQWHARNGHPEWDPTYLRLSGGLENAQGVRLPCLYDGLSALAVADMVKAGYGLRGAAGSGDRLEVTGRGRVPAEGLMSPDALRERMDIHGKYVGEVRELGVDADNSPVQTAKGLVVHRLRLHNTANPLALIEDKAEVVWDRLMRTEQIAPERAWEMLKRLGRVPRRRKLAGETELIEELSQLSKEYFFAHLDHESVPETVAAWARYGAASPDKAPVPLDELSRRAAELGSQLKNGGADGVDAEFMGMLRETVGMDGRIRAERAWSGGVGREVRLPVMERYVHSLMAGRVLSAVPDHVRTDLSAALAALDGYEGGSLRRKERLAAGRMAELAAAFREFPDLNAWRPDPDRPGLYRHLVRRPFRRGRERLKHASLSEMEEPLAAPVPEAPLQVEDDFFVRSGVPAPAAWRGRPDVVRAVETLDVVRRDFEGRPEATESGIVWKGRKFRIDSEMAPEGVTPAWEREVPLDEAAALIGMLDRRQQEVRGGMLPFLPDPEEARAMYATCVIYRDPADAAHTVRLMPGVPESPVKQARAPYVVHAWNGVYLDRYGRPAVSERDSYIPLECFTGAGEEPSRALARESRSRSLGRILETLGDGRAQDRYWWNAEQAVGCLMEDVIRLYEEQGVREGYLRGGLDLFDPVMVQSLRFVSHVLNDPLGFRLSLDRGTDAQKGMIREGRLLKKLVQEHETP